jgi:hypothetical protein
LSLSTSARKGTKRREREQKRIMFRSLSPDDLVQ